jgi:hypothetical protein
MGGTTVDESGQYVQTTSERIELPDDGVRRKIIRLPKAIPSPSASDGYTENYAFHHYFEVFRDGKREQSPLYTEEVVSKEVEYLDFNGTLGGMCIFWSIYDWDAPQYQPTEEANFVARFGEDSPYRSHKFYGAEDKENFLAHALRDASLSAPPAAVCGENLRPQRGPSPPTLARRRPVDAESR